MIGERIKAVRLGSDLTQQEFALRIGTSPSFVSEIEADKKTPGGEILISLKREFPHIDMNWLLTGEQDVDSSASNPLYDRKAERIGKRILKLTGKRRKRVDDFLDDQEELEGRKNIPRLVLAKESGLITLNIIIIIAISAMAILAAVGLNLLSGATALRLLKILPYGWIPALVAALIFRKSAVKILKHRSVSIVIFKSERFGEG